MPIHALSTDAISTISSSQVLTDSSSVVKELLENSIDALATSIAVEISADTVSTIQVNDNGQGISLEDRHHLCKRYHTSKIRDLADLKHVGCRSLGFRGEALASAAEMSATLHITTRTSRDVVATKTSFKRDGQVESMVPISHPGGTTVRIGGLFKHLPVRRQAALKCASKTLTKITRLMQAYALATPSVKLSLKVLQAKNAKADWSYVPQSDKTTAEDSVLRIFGKDLAHQCQYVARSWAVIRNGYSERLSSSHSEEQPQYDCFKIAAIFPKRGADFRDINDKGQFVSVDSRPMSCARGPMKQILSLYKQYLHMELSDKSKAKNPFLYLRIFCPEGIYDPNVEPAKDDILFENPSLLLSAVEELFRAAYETPQNAPMNDQSSIALKDGGKEASLNLPAPNTKVDNSNNPDNSDVPASLLFGPFNDNAEADQSKASIFQSGSSYEPVRFGSQPIQQEGISLDGVLEKEHHSAWHFNMYGGDEDEEDSEAHVSAVESGTLSCEVDHVESDYASKNINLSNPWIIAKMNAPKRHQPITLGTQSWPNNEDDSRPISPEKSQSLTPHRASMPSSPKAACLATPTEHRTVLPTPRYTKQRSCSHEDTLFDTPISAAARRERRRARELYGRGALDTQIQRIRNGQRQYTEQGSTCSPAYVSESEPLSPEILPQSSPNPPIGFVSAGSLRRDAQLLPNTCEEVPDDPRQASFQTRLRKPFVSPLKSKQKAPHEILRIPQDIGQPFFELPKSTNSSQRRKHIDEYCLPREDLSSVQEFSESPIAADIEESLDYERRKQLLIQQRKPLLRPDNPSESRDKGNAVLQAPLSQESSPHMNRYHAAVAKLSGERTASVDIVSKGFAIDDPRAYLIRLRKKGDQSEASIRRSGRRLKTTMLPFERISSFSKTNGLCLNISTETGTLARMLEWDEHTWGFAESKEKELGLSVPLDETPTLNERLDHLMQKWYRHKTGKDTNVKLNVAPALKKHLQLHMFAPEDGFIA
ncbi:hypothetical protein L228DRAFT_257587 [Xylona heveae TC161]|uniref:DNA mismatch repair protein S5 domain-containing protein n=1 Tax=Xylona heveae (strain CBS 132557 / TC161) TaxID=1328760 RepID=A0A165JDL7_XYLHT|nr:hypothetical protein L228DRAFT_257587 [Xylona heveae TC161]KZF26099.1 hypothetical protein L228DRAFT_257587 [Xylona heveae TC161]